MSAPRMTPEERAKDLVPDEWYGTNEERIAGIAAAIAEAEREAADEALERAAREVEFYGHDVTEEARRTWDDSLRMVASTAARRIRSLKSNGGGR